MYPLAGMSLPSMFLSASEVCAWVAASWPGMSPGLQQEAGHGENLGVIVLSLSFVWYQIIVTFEILCLKI